MELNHPEEAPDFFESLRPRVAAAFVVMWSVPIFAGIIWWPDLFERILLMQVSLLAGAGIAVRLSRRVQRWVFRPGLLLEQVRQGYFAINLWIVLAALFAIFSVTNGRL